MNEERLKQESLKILNKILATYRKEINRILKPKNLENNELHISNGEVVTLLSNMIVNVSTALFYEFKNLFDEKVLPLKACEEIKTKLLSKIAENFTAIATLKMEDLNNKKSN